MTGAEVEVEASVSGDGQPRGKASEFMGPRSEYVRGTDWWSGHVSAGGRWGQRPAEMRRPAVCSLHLDGNVVRVHGVCVACLSF